MSAPIHVDIECQDAVVDWDDPFDLVLREEIRKYNENLVELYVKYNKPLTAEEQERSRKMSQVITNPEHGFYDYRICHCDCCSSVRSKRR